MKKWGIFPIVERSAVVKDRGVPSDPPSLRAPTGHDHSKLTSWIFLACALVGVAATVAGLYLSPLAGLLIFVSGLIGIVLLLAVTAPASIPANDEEQLAALEAAWGNEVPASHEAMVRSYLDDPEAAVDALVSAGPGLSREVAHAFLSRKVIG